MTDFTYLKELETTGKTARYTMVMIALTNKDNMQHPVLICRPATEVNRAFANEQLRITKKNVPLVRSGAVSLDTIAENRDAERGLYAKHVIAGWENVIDGDGAQVAYDSTVCLEFLNSLPDFIFDEVRNFCTNPQNFVEAVSVEAIVKN